MHKLLERQLQRCFGATDNLPPPVQALAKVVEAAYQAADDERALSERSMSIASRELFDQNRLLSLKNKRLQEAELGDRERRQLQASVQAMERVLALVGHELRTPLAGIRATADFLLLDGLEPTAEWRDFVRSIQKQTVHLSDTLNQLLEVTVLSSGRANWSWGSLAIVQACGQAVETIRPLVDGQSVRLEMDVDPAGLNMLGDAGAIVRLLTNLLSNAVKHTPSGRISIRARGLLEWQEKWVTICVQDTGSGIAPELLGKLGQPFTLNSGFTGASHVTGAGLGLAICKGIIAAHGGTLSVHSRLGEGTAFTAKLRADLPKPVDQGPPAEQPLRISAAEAAQAA